MNTAITLPAGEAILGRVLNASGQPIDHKGELEHVARLPLSTPEELSNIPGTPVRLLETGIKAIDLLAPLAYGSTTGFIAGYGLGKEVLIEEILQRSLLHRQGLAVVAGMRETTYEASGLYTMMREIEVEDRIAMLFEQSTEDESARQRLLHAALTIAAHFAESGREVLLLIDSQVMMKKQMAALRRFANARDITTLLLLPVNDLHQPVDSSLLNELDVQIHFSQARARENLWPAIDPLASQSHLLTSDAITPEHQQITARVRDLLQRYYELREQVDMSSFNEEEQRIMARGERINLFLAQPFEVAEAFTDLPGAYLTHEQTIASFRDLLAGRYDTTPLQAFTFVGQIEA